MAKKIFVTGAAGFIGTAIISELIHSGYQVSGLMRSEHGKRSLLTAGAQILEGDVLVGDVNDLSILRRGADAAEAVIHTAFNHDFTKFKENCEADRKVIEALGEVLSDSHRPLVVTSGTSVPKVVPGEVATEQSPAADSGVPPRAASGTGRSHRLARTSDRGCHGRPWQHSSLASHAKTSYTKSRLTGQSPPIMAQYLTNQEWSFQ